MKKLIITLIMIFPVISLASEKCSTTSEKEIVQEQKDINTEVPKHLKGATIIIRTADGKESSVPAEQFKVVPRKQQFMVTRVKQVSKMMCSAELKNRISLMAGKGPQEGLDKSSDATSVTIESKVGAIGGVQYQRLLTDRISVGAQLQSNESALINIGLEF